MSNIAISVSELSKLYRIGGKQKAHETISSAFLSAIRKPFENFKNLRQLGSTGRDENGENVFWALKDINFTVNHGDVLGIIGRNGAGKSTLLKILAQITEPSKGKVSIHGRVASFLEVGTGFHPDLTGRENIFLNGSILGMKKKEIARKFDEIVSFSGIEKFIDTPVKRYSSGMKVRLAFSVAAHLEPEILLIDEVLAVGDAAFQKMCLAKMDDVAKGGRTILFVSHQLGMVRSLCKTGILLKNGAIECQGEIEPVLKIYEEGLESKHMNPSFIQFAKKINVPLQWLSAELIDALGESKQEFDVFEPVKLKIKYQVYEPSAGIAVGIVLERNGTQLFYSVDTDKNPERFDTREPGIYTTTVALLSPLKAGRYLIQLELVRMNIELIHRESDALYFDVIEKSFDPSLMSYSKSYGGIVAANLDWAITDYEPVQNEAI